MWTYIKENKWKSLFGVLCLGGYIYYKQQGRVATIEKEKQKEQMKKIFFEEAQASSDVTLRNSFLPQLSDKLKDLTNIKTILLLLRQSTDKEEKVELWKKMQVQGL